MNICRPANNLLLVLLSLTMLTLGFSVSGCDSLSGADGVQGPEGPQGPVGPAGENGSQIFAGSGAPGAETGNVGDYYLNQDTGELYGPKSEAGWGSPGIVLMGKDGQDGVDGQDGEDGSQIYSGSGAPDPSLGAEGDYYLDQSSYDLYGPKTAGGWGVPLNLKGADGNANVTRYIFPGHDFEADFVAYLSIMGLSGEAEMRQSAWMVYLVDSRGDYYHIPGTLNPNGQVYHVEHKWQSTNNLNRVLISIIQVEGSAGAGNIFSQIEVVRIEAGNTEDHTKQMNKGVIPGNLDVTKYHNVANYFGF